MVRSPEPGVLGHRDTDCQGSPAPGSHPWVLSAWLPRAKKIPVSSWAPAPGPGRLPEPGGCRGGRRPPEGAVPPHVGVLVRRQPRGPAGPPQPGPLRPGSGQAGWGLVWASRGGTYLEVSLAVYGDYIESTVSTVHWLRPFISVQRHTAHRVSETISLQYNYRNPHIMKKTESEFFI